MLASGLRGVKVTLDHHAEAAANDAVAVLATKAGLHPRDAFVLRTREREKTRNHMGAFAVWDARKRGGSKRSETHRHTLQKTNIEVNLVCQNVRVER